MRPVVTGRLTLQLIALATVENPYDVKVGKAFDVFEAGLKFGKHFEYSLFFMLRSEPTRNLAGFCKRAMNETNRA